MEKERTRGQNTRVNRLAEASEKAVTSPVATWNDDGFYDLSFAVGKSRRYHSKMERFYQTWSDWVVAGNAILGTGAFFSLIVDANPTIAKVLTAIIAAAAAIETVYGPSKKAQLHMELERRFTELAASIAKSDPTPANLKRLRAARLEIEADELPVRRLIDLVAQNEEARSRGVDEAKMVPLSGLQRHFGYLLDFGMQRLERDRLSKTR